MLSSSIHAPPTPTPLLFYSASTPGGVPAAREFDGQGAGNGHHHRCRPAARGMIVVVVVVVVVLWCVYRDEGICV